MPRSLRVRSLVVALAAALSVACGSRPPESRKCQAREECPAAAHCIGGACVDNRAPTPRVVLPTGALEETLLLTFGSESADPDPGDGISSRSWTFRALTAPCAPPAVSGTGPAATVRFACAGRYAVDLAVIDTLGASASATEEFDVGAYSGPALLTVGADVAVAHACAAGRCTTTPGTFSLSAAPTAAAPAVVELTWWAEPPAGQALDANRRVTFSPGPNAASPTVAIETDGQAIAGDWVFHVGARDATGVFAHGAIRVSVGNRPPQVTETVTVPNHTFDGSRFLVQAEVRYVASDPDGDALQAPVVAFHHAGDGPSATFSGAVTATPSVSYEIVVPRAAPSDALFLRGAGVERAIRFSISDVNGGTTAEVWPIQVGNRPPAYVATLPGTLQAHHAFQGGASPAYVASVPIAQWSDPDGDPLGQVPGTDTGDAVCPALDVVGGVAIAQCRVPFAGDVRVLGNLVGSHGIAQHVQDPWELATSGQGTVVPFEVLNRAPTVTPTDVWLSATCTADGCCRSLDPCPLYYVQGEASTAVASWWHDEDGDPLAVTLEQTMSGTIFPQFTFASPCTPSTCSATIRYLGNRYCEYDTSQLYRVYTTTADDGLTAGGGQFAVRVGTCR